MQQFHFVKELSMTSLRQRMTEDMQVRNLALNTQTSYLQQVSLFARHFNKSPEQLGPEDIRAYQVYLTNEKKLTPGSVLIAVAALRFLYKVSLHRDWIWEDVIPAPKKPQKLPIVLSPEEVLQFLGCVRNIKHRAILTTCYAAGLRISEAVHLTDRHRRSRMVIRVDQGKGQKDRYVMLSPKLLETLRSYWRVMRPKGWLFQGDIAGRQSPETRWNWSARRLAGFPASQANQSSQPAPCLRRSSAGIRHRCPHYSVVTRSSQPGNHRTIPADRHQQSVLDIKSARPAASSRSH